jgi:tetratricopeptide (TPR) repeat protein
MNEYKDQTIKVEQVSCDVCLKTIPVSEARSEETAGNVAHFCGLDCYEKWKYQKLQDNPGYNTNFLAGICCLYESDYKQARHFFLKAVTETDPLEVRHDVYLSYLALLDVLIDHKNGILEHCHHSPDTSHSIEPEVLSIEPEIQLNLACAEFIKGNRGRGVQAMDKLNDLKLSLKSSEEVHSFFDIVGKRKKNNNGSLKRNSLVQKSIGKIFRKKENINIAGHIEAFIRETAKNRYNCFSFNI